MKAKIGVLPLVILSTLFCGIRSAAHAQASPESALRETFVGKQVLLKLDMPATQKGVDLHFGHGDPLAGNDYENRLKEFGISLHKGDRPTVTSLVLKNDHIEFHLDGGGFGTIHDDTGPVIARVIPKSDEQLRLEKALKSETDKDKRRNLQNQIDREDSRRRFLQSQEDTAAATATQIKQQQIAVKRMQGGSRFNLRWDGNIPPEELRAEAIRMRLAAYVEFDPGATSPPQPMMQPAMQPTPAGPAGTDPVTAIHRGMSFNDLQSLLGPGQLISQETSSSGLLNQEMLYLTPSSKVHVTLVDGIVIRFTIESR